MLSLAVTGMLKTKIIHERLYRIITYRKLLITTYGEINSTFGWQIFLRIPVVLVDFALRAIAHWKKITRTTSIPRKI